MTPSESLHDRIRVHLLSDGAVMVATYTKATIYRQKHVAMFTPSKRETDTGVYVQHGKRRDYVDPQYIRFGKMS
jgi:hypothetical protein